MEKFTYFQRRKVSVTFWARIEGSAQPKLSIWDEEMWAQLQNICSVVRTLVQKEHLKSKRLQTGQRAKAAFDNQSQPEYQHCFF